MNFTRCGDKGAIGEDDGRRHDGVDAEAMEARKQRHATHGKEATNPDKRTRAANGHQRMWVGGSVDVTPSAARLDRQEALDGIDGTLLHAHHVNDKSTRQAVPRGVVTAALDGDGERESIGKTHGCLDVVRVVDLKAVTASTVTRRGWCEETQGKETDDGGREGEGQRGRGEGEERKEFKKKRHKKTKKETISKWIPKRRREDAGQPGDCTMNQGHCHKGRGQGTRGIL